MIWMKYEWRNLSHIPPPPQKNKLSMISHFFQSYLMVWEGLSKMEVSAINKVHYASLWWWNQQTSLGKGISNLYLTFSIIIESKT